MSKVGDVIKVRRGIDEIDRGRAAFGAFLDLLACSRDQIDQIDSHGLHELLRPIADTLGNGVEIQEAFFTELSEQEAAEETMFQKLCEKLDMGKKDKAA